MSICKFSANPNPKAASANGSYITRDGACDRLDFFNADELRGEDLREDKINARSYTAERQDDEAGRAGSRNHYRIVLSFDRKEESEKAGEQAKEFLAKEFPNSKAIIATHQDTENTHCHVWLDCRDRDGRKLQLDNKKYKTLDERWARQYDREYKTDYEREYKEKKLETQRARAEKTPRPKRAKDKMNRAKFKAKDIKDVGVKSYDQTGIDRDKRPITAGHSAVEDSKQRIDRTERTIDRTSDAISDRAGNGERANKTLDGTIREAKTLRADIERRDINRDTAHERDTSRGR
jgi:hypothetical protein